MLRPHAGVGPGIAKAVPNALIAVGSSNARPLHEIRVERIITNQLKEWGKSALLKSRH